MSQDTTMAIDVTPTCAREKLLPWIAGIAILVCITIGFAYYYAENLREARRARMRGVGWQVPLQSRRVEIPAGATAAQPTVKSAVFVPPWHETPNTDAVTGATPKRVSFNWAIEIVSPSVVGINTSGAQQQGASGIIVHRIGYILTNYHVVEGAKDIVVTLVNDQLIKAYPAELVESRPGLDLALIKITSTGKETFSPAPLGDSNKIVVGQDVVAIGNPFGLAQSASAGIISNAQRSLTAGNKVFENLIQTDASINPGSSGGALVNARAEVIGINTAIYSPLQAFTGIGFAIPINQAKKAFGDFIQVVQSPLAQGNTQAALKNQVTLPAAGANLPAEMNINQMALPRTGANLQMMAARTGVTRCWMGFDVHPLDSVMARELKMPIHHGVLVNRVFANSPATIAGLQRGDVIFRVDNRRVKDEKMLWAYLAGKKPGDEVRVTIFRQNSKKTFVVILAPEPPNVRALLSKEPMGGAAGATGIQGIEEISWLGIDIQPVTAGEALQEFGIPLSAKGVLVGEVEGIAAIDAGLAPGDLIKKINNQEVKDIKTFKEIIMEVDSSAGVVLDIIRQKRPFYITIRPVTQDRGAWQ